MDATPQRDVKALAAMFGAKKDSGPPPVKKATITEKKPVTKFEPKKPDPPKPAAKDPEPKALPTAMF